MRGFLPKELLKSLAAMSIRKSARKAGPVHINFLKIIIAGIVIILAGLLRAGFRPRQALGKGGIVDIVEIELTEEACMRAAVKYGPAIERALARRHLSNGTLVLYDVSSTYFEGRTCPLTAIGHSRDGKKGSLQIVFGLLCNADGCPVAVEVYEGVEIPPQFNHSCGVVLIWSRR